MNFSEVNAQKPHTQPIALPQQQDDNVKTNDKILQLNPLL